MLSSFDHNIVISPCDDYVSNNDKYSIDSILNATGNGYIKESDYVQLLENHGFKVINDAMLTLGNCCFIYLFQKLSFLFLARLTVPRQSR